MTLAISVIMSIYSEPIEWIEESINSILNQTFTDFEFIIINDNPQRKENKAILTEKKERDNRLVVIENSTNLGLTKSLNIGIQRAKGKYIARMDADDYSFERRLEIQFDFMERNPNCVVSGTLFFIKGNEYIDPKPYPIPCSNYDIRNYLLVDNCIAHPTAIIRGSILREYMLRYDEEYPYSQDYGLWCKLTAYGELRNVDIPLLHYRISDGQISSKKRRKQYECMHSIRKGYFEAVLKLNGINVPGQEIESLSARQLNNSDIDLEIKSALVKSFYLNLNSSFLSLILRIIVDLNVAILFDRFYLKKLFKKFF